MFNVELCIYVAVLLANIWVDAGLLENLTKK